MADLIGFLTDRLDEDERDVMQVVKEQERQRRFEAEHPELYAGTASYRVLPRALTEEFALAEVQAKRHIIDEHPAVTERTSWDEERTICDRCRYDDGLDTYTFPCPTLCLLALPYDTHEDYDEAWRP